MAAAEHGHKDVTQLLLAHQAKVNATDKVTLLCITLDLVHMQWHSEDLGVIQTISHTTWESGYSRTYSLDEANQGI